MGLLNACWISCLKMGNGVCMTRIRNLNVADANQTEGDVLTLLQLMESMFELSFLDMSDMRWRVATQTFRKKGE